MGENEEMNYKGMDRICRYFSKKKYYYLVFLFLFILGMMIHLITNDAKGYWDAGGYWEIGKTYSQGIKAVQDVSRGWVLPYVFGLCYRFGILLGYEYLGYQIFSSLVFAFTFTFIFTYIARILKFEAPDTKMAVSGGICGILFFFFFKGLFIYTLSDFYALALALLSIILMYEIVECRRKLYIKILEAFLLGSCLYGTYNMRTIYLFSLLAGWGVLIIWHLYLKSWKQLLITSLACLTGMLICAIPQYMTNHNLLGIYSWRVPTQQLMLKQLQWGIGMERYATYVGDPAQYGAPGMEFINHAGVEILNRFQIMEFTSYGQLLKLIIRYPLDFLGIYVRHFLNILYPVYPNQYIYDITKDKSLLLILFYTVFFIAMVRFISSFKWRSSRWVWLALILLPCICILPGAVEIRFFIALYFLIFMYAVLGIKEFMMQVGKQKVRYIMSYLVGFLLYVAYVGMLLGTTADGISIIN